MNSIARGASALILFVSLGPAQAGAQLREGSIAPETRACAPGAAGPAARVRIQGFKNRQGGLLVRLYGDRREDFLRAGRKLKRIELRVPARGEVDVCIALPGVRRYAIAVLHDVNGDLKFSASSDGVGFSNNPKLGLGEPALSKVLFTARPGIQTIPIILNYRRGLGLRPLAGDR
ncbi:DUF2141 domain-containing protein [Sphingosinicella sp. BN140058]|uniref:DUF2141 domain-containing protein n=1 Tax=Sphingosinicella sp. BN140058 TaxID=1892855 RepID=UPI0013EB0A51|nr:DUF2141 domain-containing protein [Sphingosinicella sp. BN140058]